MTKHESTDVYHIPFFAARWRWAVNFREPNGIIWSIGGWSLTKCGAKRAAERAEREGSV